TGRFHSAETAAPPRDAAICDHDRSSDPRQASSRGRWLLHQPGSVRASVPPMFAADFPEWLVRLAALSLGALFGSFFNVAIYRWPRDLSVVSPGSRCPSCGEPVKPWLNLPIVGWLMLRGKARCCGATLSPRYFLVEVLGAVLALAVAERYFIGAEYGMSAIRAGLDFALYFAFVGGMIVATFVDLEWMEIPDEVT